MTTSIASENGLCSFVTTGEINSSPTPHADAPASASHV